MSRVLMLVPIALLLVGAVACGDDDDTDSEAFDVRMFEGPFPIVSEKVQGKMRDFVFYSQNNVTLSHVEKLDAGLLKESVKQYRDSGINGEQTYNYAVDLEGNILVAVWNNDAGGKVEDLLDDKDVCIRTEISTDTIVHQGKMINFALQNGSDPLCTLLLDRDPDTDKRPALLDALSKHFMLIQGTQRARTISTFNGWANASRTPA